MNRKNIFSMNQVLTHFNLTLLAFYYALDNTDQENLVRIIKARSNLVFANNGLSNLALIDNAYIMA